MKNLVFNYFYGNSIESVKGCHYFKVCNNSKKEIGNYFKQLSLPNTHLKDKKRCKDSKDDLFSFGFLTNGCLNSALINCNNLGKVAEYLPETVVTQLQVILEDWATSNELNLFDDMGCLSENTMRDILNSLSAEELYDFLINEYNFDVGFESTYCGTVEEVEEVDEAYKVDDETEKEAKEAEDETEEEAEDETEEEVDEVEEAEEAEEETEDEDEVDQSFDRIYLYEDEDTD
jgi:hypothetical protein